MGGWLKSNCYETPLNTLVAANYPKTGRDRVHIVAIPVEVFASLGCSSVELVPRKKIPDHHANWIAGHHPDRNRR
jgi:hypothetical protein